MTLPSSGTETISERLKNARAARGLSIEEAALATRIRAHYLQAIEEGNFSALPSAVQGRGFLHSYASFLGVELQPPTQTAGAAFPTPEINRTPPTPTGVPSPDSTKNNQTAPAVQAKKPAQVYKPRRKSQREKQAGEMVIVTPLSTSQAIFENIGQTLRQRRESLSLSLTDIEQYTRLRSHYLQALEKGSVDDLPSPVQGRGMLNNYALFLNLDADAILLQYADGLQARRIERLGAQAPHRSEAKQVAYPGLRRILSLDLVIGVLLILTLVVFLVWGISQVMSEQKQQVALATLPPVSEVLAVTPSPTFTTPGDATAQAATASPQGTDLQPRATLAFTPLPADSGPIQVYIVARQQAWLRVTVDGKVVFTGRVIPGNAYPFTGSESVEMLTGSAAALQVFYNQTDVGSLGLVGQVVDLVFNTNGMVLPTATNVPTPTKTDPVTATPIKSGTPSAVISPTPTK